MKTLDLNETSSADGQLRITVPVEQPNHLYHVIVAVEGVESDADPKKLEFSRSTNGSDGKRRSKPKGPPSPEWISATFGKWEGEFEVPVSDLPPERQDL